MLRAALIAGPLGSSTHREARAMRMVRRNRPSRVGTVTVRARVGRMLGAPRSRSAHARRGAGDARRLHTPTPPGVAALSTGVGPPATACRRSTMSALRARTASGAPSWRRAPTRCLPAACWSTASPASAAAPVPTSICSHFRANAGIAAQAATPSASQSGRSERTPPSSRPCRTDRPYSASRSGSASTAPAAPTACTDAACSARCEVYVENWFGALRATLSGVKR